MIGLSWARKSLHFVPPWRHASLSSFPTLIYCPHHWHPPAKFASGAEIPGSVVKPFQMPILRHCLAKQRKQRAKPVGFFVGQRITSSPSCSCAKLRTTETSICPRFEKAILKQQTRPEGKGSHLISKFSSETPQAASFPVYQSK